MLLLLRPVYLQLWRLGQRLRRPDGVGRVPMIAAGMLLQGVAISLAGWSHTYAWWLVAVALLGLGTAMVYPTLLAAVGDAVHPFERATTIGVYRFWRDAGAMSGALIGGILADLFGFGVAIQAVAALTVASGCRAVITMRSRVGVPLSPRR